MKQNKQYEFYIVVLTKQHKLVDAYVKATNIAQALDKMIDQLDLGGNIEQYKFTIRREIKLYPESNEL